MHDQRVEILTLEVQTPDQRQPAGPWVQGKRTVVIPRHQGQRDHVIGFRAPRLNDPDQGSRGEVLVHEPGLIVDLGRQVATHFVGADVHDGLAVQIAIFGPQEPPLVDDGSILVAARIHRRTVRQQRHGPGRTAVVLQAHQQREDRMLACPGLIAVGAVGKAAGSTAVADQVMAS